MLLAKGTRISFTKKLQKEKANKSLERDAKNFAVPTGQGFGRAPQLRRYTPLNMEFTATTLILVILSPVVVIAIILLIITPYYKKNLPKTIAIEKEYKERLDKLKSNFKASMLIHKDIIHAKRQELLAAINGGLFRDEWELQEFIDSYKEEIDIVLKECKEDSHEFLHNSLKLAKERYKKSTQQFHIESGYADTMKVMKMDIKDFFK